MRTKEFAHDYRYFPDPDLLPINVDEQWKSQVKQSLPELPDERRRRFISEYRLPEYDADLLTSRKDIAYYFEAALQEHANPKSISNWITGDIFRVVKERKLDEGLYIRDWPVKPRQIAELVQMIDEGAISGKIAKTVFDGMLDSDRSPRQIVSEKGLEQVSDTGSIEAAVNDVLAANANQVAAYKSGNEKVFGFLVGQIMKATKGKVNPQLANEILRQKLSE
jgi:aspartyl-tRNA(Asn)/glutamyl-tRNA(Gln) amidotransferase subunit B